MDMFLLAVGMIGITVASLGIVNTMVMSILERYREIGIMKAVGATDGDVQKIFLVESGMIGLLGGLFGLALARVVSFVINQVVNGLHVSRRRPVHSLLQFLLVALPGRDCLFHLHQSCGRPLSDAPSRPRQSRRGPASRLTPKRTPGISPFGQQPI